MSKLKVGDIVKVVSTEVDYSEEIIGKIGKITKQHYKLYELDIDTKNILFYEHELELVNIEPLIEMVQQWSIDRKLDTTDPLKQTVKLMEELGELASGLLKNKQDIVIDSLGDILVVLIILHQQLGLTFEETLGYAWNEIKDRKGKTENGVFIKEDDL